MSRDVNGDRMSAFGEIGLFLHERLDYPAYTSTPRNSLTFASTGGDGVHYGFLVGSQFKESDPPIVMTVPMNFDLPNVIVGENLEEFLALGCRAGYFSLEQLVYDRVRTIRDLETGDLYPDTTDEELDLLTAICAEFEVAPWPNVEGRLDQLRDRFHELLDVAGSGATS